MFISDSPTSCFKQCLIVFPFFFCGQIVHEKVYDEVLERLKKAYAQVKIGDPLDGMVMLDN